MQVTEFFTKVQDRFSADVFDMLAELKGLIPGFGLWQMSLTVRYESALHTLGQTEATAVFIHCEADIQLIVPPSVLFRTEILDQLSAVVDSHGLGLVGTSQLTLGEGPYLFSFGVKMKTAWVDGVEVGADVVQV